MAAKFSDDDPVASADERRRLSVLAAHAPDSLEGDAELAAITDFAAKLCDAPIALVSLVEAEQQRFVARTGLAAGSTPRSMSFCQYAMTMDRAMVVPDAREDQRFRDNALVTGPPFIRFYAGAPLVSEEGEPLGALCVISTEPRPRGLTPLQRQGLDVLSRAVMRRLIDRRAHLGRQRERAAAREALAESERRFDALADAIPQMAWSTTADGRPDYFNARWYEFTGAAHGSHLGEAWVDALHPDDRALAARVWAEAVESGEPYEVEYRLRRHDGEYRWTLARGLPMRGGDGTIERWFGTNTDIHEKRLLLESRDILSRELSHRIKNIFTVVAGLLRFEARSHPELKPMVAAMGERIAALGRAHDYVRPSSPDADGPKSLHGMLADLFAPYTGSEGPRVRVEGEDLPLADEAATPLALLFHELATNAAKYGALARDGGEVRMTIARDGEDLCFQWREDGGEVQDMPGENGFGSQLIDLSVGRQLGGAIERRFAPEGFAATIRVPINRLAGSGHG